MGLKVGTTTCLHWTQPFVSHSPSSSQALASSISLPSSRRRARSEGAFVWRQVHGLGRSSFFGTQSTKLYRTRSSEQLKSGTQTLRRACSASLEAFSDEEFSRRIQELAQKFQSSERDDGERTVEAEPEPIDDFSDPSNANYAENQTISFRNAILEPIEPPDWPTGDAIEQASIERKANSVEIPLSLRIIKRKKQWPDGFREAGESAYCSVKKAFSSMVFIIRELHRYSLQMREILFYEDLQGIIARVQKEIHASFVWLFERVFSHTPTLMVYVMILLANYSVHSMSSNTALAAAAPPLQTYATPTESVSVMQDETHTKPKFDSSAIKAFKVSSLNGKSTSIGGNNGGGGKYRPAASGTEGDGRSDGSVSWEYHRTILPEGASPIGSSRTDEEESVSDRVTREGELSLWNSMVEEASRMQASLGTEALNQEMMHRLVSPVDAKIESDEYEDYFRTELLYQTALAQDPCNSLLLANYAQFLYLVTHDYDRAEEYFNKAAEVEPKDAEALSKYASFLWQVKNDLWAAEETYLEAISADPSNSYHAANYANFLWNTGGEDTCFPLDSPDTNAGNI